MAFYHKCLQKVYGWILNWFVIIKIRFPAHSSLQIQENRHKLNRCATLADIFHDPKTRGWWSSWTTSFLKKYGNKIKICLCDKNWPFLNVIQSKFKYILANAFKISSKPYVRWIGRQQCMYMYIWGGWRLWKCIKIFCRRWSFSKMQVCEYPLFNWDPLEWKQKLFVCVGALRPSQQRGHVEPVS